MIPVRRTKLRTKTGCFMCRKRRKKCSEEKPRCAGCKRQSFECIWPGNETVAIHESSTKSLELLNRPFSDDSTKIGLIRSATYGLPGITTSIDHQLSLHLRERFLPNVLRANAHPSFHNWNYMITIGTESTITMRTFLAMAAMHASWTDAKYKMVAARYYNTAITSLRKVIADGGVNGSEDWLLLTTNFLSLYEINHGSKPSHRRHAVASHLHGLASILEARIANLKLSTPKHGILIHTQDKLAVESLLFFVSTLSLYYSEIDQVGERICWDGLEFYLDADCFIGVSPHDNSPILGSNWKLYKIIFELSRISHNLPLECDMYKYTLKLQADLRFREIDTKNGLTGSEPKSQMAILQQQTLLYILASQIVVNKILSPEITTSHTQIRELVAECLEIVRCLSGVRGGLFLCWPVAIVSCAVERDEDIPFLRRKLEEIWNASNCGEVQRVRDAVEVLWDRLRSTDEGNVFNILDVLVCSGGMFRHPSLRSTWSQ